MSAQENKKIAERLYEAFNSRNFEQGAALTAEDVEVLNVPLGVTLRGVEGYRQFMQSWANAFSDSRIEISNMVAGEHGVVTEFRGIGTHTGPLVGPAGEIPATGKSVDIPFCEVLQIQNGKIVRDHLYYDVVTMMSQLGLMK